MSSSALELVWQRTMFLPDDLPAGLGPADMPDKFTPWKIQVEKAGTTVRPPWAPPATLPCPWDDASIGSPLSGFSYLPTLADLGFPDGVPAAADDGGAMADDVAGRFKGGETVALARLQDWVYEQVRTYMAIGGGLALP